MAHRLIERFFGVRPAEVGPALLCALCYFLVLASWFVIRPVREQMGLAGGVENLNWLFFGTLTVTLAATPLYGALAHALPRGLFIGAMYVIFVGVLAAFGGAFHLVAGDAEVWIGRAFYVWSSVLNMFLLAVFTALMVDVWSLDGSRRVFGLIAVGGTLGAVSGSAITAALAQRVPTPGLLGISSAGFALAAALMILVQRRFSAERGSDEPAKAPMTLAQAWAGVWLVARSPYLLGVCAFMLCLTVLSSFVYFEQARIIDASVETREAQRALFAQINLWTQTLTLLAQVFLTAHALRRLGVGLTLLAMPVVTLAGFAALAFAPVLAVLVVFQVVRGASNYAFSKPAREILFTVVSRDEKYKAKGFIDTFVYRGGDAVGSLADKAIVSMAPLAVPFVAMSVAVAWCAVALGLGKRLANAQPGDGAEPAATPTPAAPAAPPAPQAPPVPPMPPIPPMPRR